MSHQWFRMYCEFANDPKVQMLSESDQRRYIMLLCLRCSNGDVTLHDEEVAFQLRISNDDWNKTKAILLAKGLISEENKPVAWDKRQYVSDSSAERVAKYRNKKKQQLTEEITTENVTESEVKQACNVTVTPPDTDTDTDTEIEPNGSVASKLPTCPTDAVVQAYHAYLPELPAVRLLNDSRKKAISSFWRWVLTSKKTNGEPRATDSGDALEWINAYFIRASENDFLMGRHGSSGKHAAWKADLDFLLTEKGKRHVIEKTEGKS